MRISRRRWFILIYLAVLLAVLGGIHLFWPYLFAGEPLWQGVGSGPHRIHVRICPEDAPSGASAAGAADRPLLIFYRAAGDWRWRSRTERIAGDAAHLSYRFDGDLLHIAYDRPDHAIGDLVVILASSR